jgi:hypothetical protein
MVAEPPRGQTFCVTAASLDAVLITGNAEDFDGIPGLEVEVVG